MIQAWPRANLLPDVARQTRRLLPLFVFLAIALLGVGAAVSAWLSDQRAERTEFAAITSEATNRIEARISRHMLLIEATAALFEAKANRVSPDDFDTYFDSLSLAERHPGIAGLGYVAFVSRDERPALGRAIGQSDPSIWPETGEDYAAAVVLFRSIEPGPPPNGYDAYSEAARRVAIDRAIAEGVPIATEPVRLVRDPADPQPSFAIFAPVYAENFGIPARSGTPPLPTGLVFGGFRIGDLLRAALDTPPPLPVHLRVFSGDDTTRVLYEYGAPLDADRGSEGSVDHLISVAGQEWRLEFRPTAAFSPSSVRNLALLLGVASVTIAVFGAGLLREQARAHRTADLLAETTQINLRQKELMLQEMKHRIKNAIARILAIARQTAAGADDLDDFSATFTQRLQAMSSAQDLLTRSAWQCADLRMLISEELTQVFGPEFDATRLTGPAVEIDDKTTRALGLTFHELATNALKYGAAREGKPDLDVDWRIAQRAGGAELTIDWREHCGQPIAPLQENGFGTRLIEANVRHDLGGRIEREYGEDGLRLRLRIPLRAAPRATLGPAFHG